VTAEFARIKRQALTARALNARLRESQKLLFSQMQITESLLTRAAQPPQKTYHRELTRFVSDVLERFGIPVKAAAVSTGEDQRMLIELYAPKDDEPDPELIEDCLSEALQKPLTFCGTEIAGDVRRLLLRSAGGFCVSAAAAQCAVHEDEPCGDCWDTFTDGDGAYYLAVSDGMGSGRRAALDARIVLSDFRQLVQSGVECREAAKIINALMMTRSGEERFATLDIAKICTDTATVTLYKYGAGPTFIRHAGRITLFQAATNPIGILPDAEPFTAVMQLERGDMLCLLTDGLDEQLFPYIRKTMQQGGDLQALAHAVCNKAQRSAKGDPRDDMTVLAATVSAAVADD
ncbi:MAG: SpoIIE family protein phosphatase, partial [Oscillospiraceae bacterium]|nr:SpoIIE family protein phosphatase [Oscillospiraceae bacterium]